MKNDGLVATQEVAQVYDLSMKEATSRLKALQLQQKIECIPVKKGSFWKADRAWQE
ncbi:hypothetical protein [Salicibibacter kimchii]|nr:hypothetical protein [Salicibibacter kimchii]